MDWVNRYNEIDARAEVWAEKEKARIIKEAFKDGVLLKEIARKLRTNRKSIYRLLKKYQDVELGDTP